jgi:hypothetical protein
MVLLARSDAAKDTEILLRHQAAVDLADAGRSFRYRDARFTEVFDAVFTAAGMRIVKTPVRAPRANAIAESLSHS